MNNNIKKKHDEILYVSALVKTDKAGGSGTVVYSKPTKKGSEEYETYILTNWHVIEDAISVKKEWDPLLSKRIDKERRKTVNAEFYRYQNMSRNVGRTAIEADIMTYNRDRDIALVKLRSNEQVKNVAKLYLGDVKDVHIFDPVYVCGCSLGHSPIPTRGEITSQDDEIENHPYWMSNGQIIYGNSGGGVFLIKQDEVKGEEEYLFIGIPSRISVVGWGDSITHMGYFIPIHSIYEWLEKECYQFIYDLKFTSEKCEKMRKKKKEKAQKLFEEKREVEGEEEDDKDEDTENE